MSGCVGAARGLETPTEIWWEKECLCTLTSLTAHEGTVMCWDKHPPHTTSISNSSGIPGRDMLVSSLGAQNPTLDRERSVQPGSQREQDPQVPRAAAGSELGCSGAASSSRQEGEVATGGGGDGVITAAPEIS